MKHILGARPELLPLCHKCDNELIKYRSEIEN